MKRLLLDLWEIYRLRRTVRRLRRMVARGKHTPGS
jgi:hypothetical protein